MRRCQRFPAMIMLVAGALAVSSVHAHVPESVFEAALIRSELVFEGEVIDVGYAHSTPPVGARHRALAHTFVTYRVDRIYRGWIADTGRDGSEFFTLRFMGGVEGDDEYTYVSTIPLFDVGDQDLLMVQGNGRGICPLVGCRQGRYRLIDGFVYNEDGQEIISTAEANLLRGQPRFLRDTMTHTMGEVQIEIIEQTEPSESETTSPPAPSGLHYDTGRFRALLTDTLQQLEGAGLLVPPDPVRSQDITGEFQAALAVPVTALPPVDSEVSDPDLGFLLADRLEQVFLAHNRGNPVLSPRISRLIRKFRRREMRRIAKFEERRRRRR